MRIAADQAPFARIDRSRPVRFVFDGRSYEGFAGDTLASALLANDVRVVGRSFKLHRARGIMGQGAEEANALVTLGEGAATEPNVRATMIELTDGLVARSVNTWPSARVDLGAVVGWFGLLLPAGFYYKTFMGPGQGAWHIYERFIRRAAGLGHAPRATDDRRYDKRHAHCDVLVVGAGPAGLTAAIAAADTCNSVLVLDEQTEAGGSALGMPDRIVGMVDRLRSAPNVRVLMRTTAIGLYEQNLVVAVERMGDNTADIRLSAQRLWKIRAERVVLATGAIERPLVFDGNDLPGVMLASASATYAMRYAVACGRRAVLVTNNDGIAKSAESLRMAGIEIAAIVDTRPSSALAPDGIEVLRGHGVVRARGRSSVTEVEIAPLTPDGKQFLPRRRRIDCDLIAVSGGWNPTLHLLGNGAGRTRYAPEIACFIADDLSPTVAVVGAAAGELGEGYSVRPAWRMPAVGRGAPWRQFIDLHNDVTVGDLALAARENYRSVEHLKRYTTMGMAHDQGKTSSVNALGILSEAIDRPLAALGTTRARPPYTPVAFAAVAGRQIGALYAPKRELPAHVAHLGCGAVFAESGGWMRPMHYPLAGESTADAIRREVLAVRNAVGIVDNSALGKVEIHGPDAAILLDRLYSNDWGSLAVGRARYGLMLTEDGMVFDDGVTARLSDTHYLMTTTSAGAGTVVDWIELWLQRAWRDLRVFATPVTHHWADLTIAGPRARDLLGRLSLDMDLSPEAFPHLAIREGTVAGLPARILRASFTGELSFEVMVPARSADQLYNAVMEAGRDLGITPFGVDATLILRAEKGHILIGLEADGTTTPDDLGLGRLVSRKKDFIGRRSLTLADRLRPDRPQLVGLQSDDDRVLPGGGVVWSGDSKLGHVVPMSSCRSPVLGRCIALALIAGGRDRIGSAVTVTAIGSQHRASVVSPVFLDPKNGRIYV
ncbi:MAG: FAD-binding protein [Alphaproteobacteria bacterium]|nr:FAD-binding protein [Alphaproteobacteria bacterium]